MEELVVDKLFYLITPRKIQQCFYIILTYMYSETNTMMSINIVLTSSEHGETSY